MKRFLIAISLVLVATVAAQGAVIVQDTWSADVDEWTGTNMSPPGPVNATISWNSSGWLQISNNTGGSVEEDYIYETNGELAGNMDWRPYNGTSSNVYAISFNFYSSTASTPDSLLLYLSSGGTNWYYVINGVGSGWGWYYANLVWGPGNFYNDQGYNSAANFDAALQDVDQVGIVLTYHANVSGQIFGLDNFTLEDAFIPEPRDYVLMAAALIGLAYVFRRRLSAQLAVATARLRR